MSRLSDLGAFEAVCPDLLPTCPRCGDLSAPGATHCGSCRAALTEAVAYVRRGTRLLRNELGRWEHSRRAA